MAKYKTLEDGFAATGIDRAERHLFLCLGPDCAPMEEGQVTWDYLKRRCSELKLSGDAHEGRVACACASAGRGCWFIPRAFGTAR